ncbi:MAG: hypothetical protein M3270_09080 [Thermoproteota archaeon]|nr:hypothetical protein [Thermoproteota archaeon]
MVDDANLWEEKHTYYDHPYRSNKSEEAILVQYMTQAITWDYYSSSWPSA